MEKSEKQKERERENNLNKYYFAYGININEKYMEERCGSDNYSFAGIAFLLNYGIIYGGGDVAYDRWGGSARGIIPLKYGVVIGCAYCVNNSALKKLDGIEHATGLIKNKLYTRIEKNIILDKKEYSSNVYIPTEHFLKFQETDESWIYRDEIRQGLYTHLSV